MSVLDYEIPDELYYSKEHEWVRADVGEVVVGITDYAQKQLHDIVYVEIQKAGTDVEQFESIGAVESVKSVSDIYAPVSGKINKVNEELGERPELLNEDPYGKGWLVRVNPRDFKKDKEKLMTAPQYADYIKGLK